MSDHTRSNHFVLGTAEALDYAITAIRLMNRDEAIRIVAAIRDHLDGATCDDASCVACYEPAAPANCTACGGRLTLWQQDPSSPCFFGHPVDQASR